MTCTTPAYIYERTTTPAIQRCVVFFSVCFLTSKAQTFSFFLNGIQFLSLNSH
jgi:hypothetical protein